MKRVLLAVTRRTQIYGAEKNTKYYNNVVMTVAGGGKPDGARAVQQTIPPPHVHLLLNIYVYIQLYIIREREGALSFLVEGYAVRASPRRRLRRVLRSIESISFQSLVFARQQQKAYGGGGGGVGEK